MNFKNQQSRTKSINKTSDKFGVNNWFRNGFRRKDQKFTNTCIQTNDKGNVYILPLSHMN